MNTHELMIKTNHHLIKGGELTGTQKASIVRQLLDARSSESTKRSFYKGVRFPGNIDGGGRHMDEKLTLKGKGVHGNVLWYYWLCLSELPLKLAKPEIASYKDRITGQLGRSSVMNSESDKTNHPVMICVLRNCLCRLPEYSHIKDVQPYINEKDGRLYFDMNILCHVTPNV